MDKTHPTTDSSGTLRFDETPWVVRRKSLLTHQRTTNYTAFLDLLSRSLRQTPEDTILFTTGGVGLTKQEWNYGYYGDDKDPGTSGIITLDAGSVHWCCIQGSWVGSGSLFGFGERQCNLELQQIFCRLHRRFGLYLRTTNPIDWGSSPVQLVIDQNWGLITETDLIKRPFGIFSIRPQKAKQDYYIFTNYWCRYFWWYHHLSGPLVHPEVDYTPHYGIDQNTHWDHAYNLR